jgi:uncharacterized protein
MLNQERKSLDKAPRIGAISRLRPVDTMIKWSSQLGRVLKGGLIVSALILPLAACDNVSISLPTNGGASDKDNFSCPRPPEMMQMANFNSQEREIRYFRRLAFGNDFFAQLELANRYSAKSATDKNLEDPVESATWLVMALANSSGYDPINATDKKKGTMKSKFDKCRANERVRGYRALNEALSRMDQSERDAVRDRVIYIYSTMAAEGYRTLSRLYDEQYGPMGEPIDNPEAVRAAMRENKYGRPFVRTLFQRSDVDAYLYNYKASETGDISAYVLLKDFEQTSPNRRTYASFVNGKARRWVAPFEFYPTDAPRGGVPHSDLSRQSDETQFAVARTSDELPFIHVGRALKYLDMAPEAVDSPEKLEKQTLDALRQSLGMPLGERMTNHDRVRAIQLAATHGDPASQLVLAVMYTEGVGVRTDLARAYYWFEQAARQGSPQAKFAISNYFDLGVAGIADQNKAESVVLQMDSALAGFKPSASRLKETLARVSGTIEP